jgi:uncharacterized protein
MRKTLIALTALAAFAVPAQAQQAVLMTGPQGGSWYPLGGAMQAMASDAGVASIQVMPGGGIANVQGVQNGDADLGFANSISTVDAIEGASPSTARPTTCATSPRSTRSISRWSCRPTAASRRSRTSKASAW